MGFSAEGGGEFLVLEGMAAVEGGDAGEQFLVRVPSVEFNQVVERAAAEDIHGDEVGDQVGFAREDEPGGGQVVREMGDGLLGLSRGEGLVGEGPVRLLEGEEGKDVEPIKIEVGRNLARAPCDRFEDGCLDPAAAGVGFGVGLVVGEEW